MSGLDPRFAVLALPAQVGVGAFEDRGLEAIGRLPLEIEQRLGRAQTVLLLGRDEDHVAGPDRPYPVVRFHRRLAVDDEIKVLAVLVQMQRRGRILLVVHDAGQHVVDIGEFLIDEENALARLLGVNQRGQIPLLEYISHQINSFCDCYFAGTRCAVLSLLRISSSLSISAKASEMYSVLPSHSTISTRPCEPASACVDLVCERCGINRLTTPPRSTDRPGSPIGSYSAEDS